MRAMWQALRTHVQGDDRARSHTAAGGPCVVLAVDLLMEHTVGVPCVARETGLTALQTADVLMRLARLGANRGGGA